MVKSRFCLMCGNPLEPNQQKYCSSECRGKAGKLLAKKRKYDLFMGKIGFRELLFNGRTRAEEKTEQLKANSG